MKHAITRRKFLAATAAAAVPPSIASPLRGMPALISLAEATGADSVQWRDTAVIDLAKSPFAKLKPVPVHAVVIEEGFWAKRRRTNVQSSIPTMRDQLLRHGRLDNFKRLTSRSIEPQKGPVYSDSDIYKWIEAVGFTLQSEEHAELRANVDGMARDIVAAQEPSGYLDTYYVEDRKPLRMTYPTQTTGHELYNIGHLLQGAIAYYRATGDRTLLDAGVKFVDNFLLPSFGPGANQIGIVAGHPEIEMSLIELYRTTHEKRYIDLAGYILRGDERIPLRDEQIAYMFCGKPFTSRTRLEGHAVRAMYACCGATDYYLETGDPEYWKTLNTLWDDLANHQLYVTGGVGARQEGEAFGDAYELPNARAYGESCAAIGNMMWNWRMLAASGEARFADVMERALYNGINSGMSLDGTTYCYRNPLAYDPAGGAANPNEHQDAIRNEWYNTTCCPPNLERTFAALPGYLYSTSDEGVYVHLYDNSRMTWSLSNGTAIGVRQETNYPWEGNVQITVSPAEPQVFAVFVRIPGWSQRNGVKVNGKEVEGARPGEYMALRRRWAAGDVIELSFDMRTQVLEANRAVSDDLDRVAFQRGPVVYCMEGLDQLEQGNRSVFASYSVQADGATNETFAAGLLEGVVVLEHPGFTMRGGREGALYHRVESMQQARHESTTVKLIPYYAWANRAPTAMQVWIPARTPHNSF